MKTETYKFPSREFKKIGIVHLVFLVILFGFCIYFYDEKVFLIVFLVLVIFFSPSVWLFMDYYLENRNTSFIYDFKNISIIKNGKRKDYLYSDIEKSIYHLTLSKRKGYVYEELLFCDFGYWEVEFKNGDRYFLTNLIHDIHKRKKGKNTKIKYRVFPYISRKDTVIKPDIPLEKKSLYQKYVEKSNFELQEILDRPHLYREEALRIAKLLLEKRKII